MKQELKKTIHHEVHKILDEAVALRRRFHQIPEKSFEEVETAQLIVGELKKMGIPFEEGLAGTGIVATINGKCPGEIVALRTDMDALNIDEETAKPYASRHKGYSHGCGHDGHIVCVLMAACVLSVLSDQLAGTVKIIFQPGEEIGLGARAMIEAGALGNPLPSSIFALHSWPYLDSGMVASIPGAVTSINDLFDIAITEKRNCGMQSHESISPIVTLSYIAQQISLLTASGNNEEFPCVVSIGVIQGGTNAKTTPKSAYIKGTIRSCHEEQRMKLHEKIQNSVYGICENNNVDADIHLHGYCPSVINNPILYRLFEEVAEGLFIPEKQACLSAQSMGSDDFGFFTQKIPGLLIRLGNGSTSAPLHTGNFDFCDDSLESGIMILVGLVMEATKSGFLQEGDITQ